MRTAFGPLQTELLDLYLRALCLQYAGEVALRVLGPIRAQVCAAVPHRAVLAPPAKGRGGEMG